MKAADVALGPDEVHVLLARFDAVSESGLQACRQLLSPEEREREARFVFDRDRRQFAIAHALVRTTLSRYAPTVSPAAWRFRAGSHGKPEIEGDAPPLRFNLSHCDGLAACAVTRSWDVGVDVENVERPVTPSLLRRSFAPAEAEHLARLEALQPPEPLLLRDHFFALWTLKEAYIKARGLGLALPLNGFAFTLEPLAVAFEASDRDDRDDASLWHFERRSPTPRHVLALAVKRPSGAAVRVSYQTARLGGD